MMIRLFGAIYQMVNQKLATTANVGQGLMQDRQGTGKRKFLLDALLRPPRVNMIYTYLTNFTNRLDQVLGNLMKED